MAIAIKLTPLQYAKKRLLEYEARLRGIEKIPVGRKAGCLTRTQKFNKEMACRAAIAALKEITEVQYLPRGDGQERNINDMNRLEILPREALGGMVANFDDCGSVNLGEKL